MREQEQQEPQPIKKRGTAPAISFKESFIAMETVVRARAVYVREYSTNKRAAKELIKLLDADGRKFNTTHFREADLLLIQFTLTAISTNSMLKYIRQLSSGYIRLYIKRFRHDQEQRKKLKVKLEEAEAEVLALKMEAE